MNAVVRVQRPAALLLQDLVFPDLPPYWRRLLHVTVAALADNEAVPSDHLFSAADALRDLVGVQVEAAAARGCSEAQETTSSSLEILAHRLRELAVARA